MELTAGLARRLDEAHLQHHLLRLHHLDRVDHLGAELARDRTATFHELADEAFTDLLKKHGIPIDLRDALRKSVKEAGNETKAGSKPEKRK